MPREKRVSWLAFPVVIILISWNVSPCIAHDSGNLQAAVIIAEPERPSIIRAETPHDPIAIDSDANFYNMAIAEEWPGDGQPETPFIIEDLDIDLNGAAGFCINITDTTVHFIVRNCRFTGASVSGYSAVYLNNVENGQILSNNCTFNSRSIRLISSTNNIIANNDCSYNLDRGIFLSGNSDYNLIESNTCNYNIYGIFIDDWSEYNTVKGNNCTSNTNDGIHLLDSQYNTVDGNICCNSNGHGICISSGFENVVQYNICFNNEYGIRLLWSADYAQINYNICYNNTHGISMKSTWYASLYNNTCTNNTYGISVDQSSFWYELSRNTCTNNTYGFYVFMTASDPLRIVWNVFANNTNNGVTLVGGSFDYNYWSDYSGIDANGDGIGETAYSREGINDPHPLTFLPYLPRWTNDTPDDRIIEFGEFFSYDFNASAYGPFSWGVNDTRFSIDSEGLLSAFPTVGKFGLEVTVTSIYGRIRSATFTLTVAVDAGIPPIWLTLPTSHILPYDEEFVYSIVAVDSSGISAWELNDSINFNLESTIHSVGGIATITNSSVLQPGVYPLNLSVYDSYNNGLSAVFTIRVEPPVADTTAPVWIVGPFSVALDYSEILLLHLGAWDESGIDHWWMNDTTHFTIDEIGVIQNTAVLEPGAYGLEVRAYDPFDNYCSAMFTVTVLEVPTTTTTEGGMNLLLSFGIGGGVGGIAVLAAVLLVMKKRT